MITPCYACRYNVMIEGTYISRLIDTPPLCRNFSPCHVRLNNTMIEGTNTSTLACLPLTDISSRQHYVRLDGAVERTSIDAKMQVSATSSRLYPRYGLGGHLLQCLLHIISCTSGNNRSISAERDTATLSRHNKRNILSK